MLLREELLDQFVVCHLLSATVLLMQIYCAIFDDILFTLIELAFGTSCDHILLHLPLRLSATVQGKSSYSQEDDQAGSENGCR